MNIKVQTRVWRVVFLIIFLLCFIYYTFGPMIINTLVGYPIVRNASHIFFRLETSTKHEENFTKFTKCNVFSNLGPIQVNRTIIDLDNPIFNNITMGGYYKPPYNCTADRVAIIVPYRNRLKHLSIFLNNIHQFLMVQQVEYGIFIIEQYGESDFNRGKLMNVGFVESQNLKEGGWDCFIFHDVDLVPLNTANFYSCPNTPRHMSAAIDVFAYRLPYKEIFGGVTAMSKTHFTTVNGFSNRYWGWGGEDDDMYNRIVSSKLSIERYNMSIAQYIMLKHKKAVPNPLRHSLLKESNDKFREDGLSSLHYFVLKMNRYHLFTLILVDIDL